MTPLIERAGCGHANPNPWPKLEAVAITGLIPRRGGLDWVFEEAKDCMIELGGKSLWDQATMLLLRSVRDYIAQEVRS